MEAKQREKVGGKRDGKILRDREKMGRKRCTKGKGDITHVVDWNSKDGR